MWKIVKPFFFICKVIKRNFRIFFYHETWFHFRDLATSMSRQEFESLFRWDDILLHSKHRISVKEISAVSGKGLSDVLEWLLQHNKWDSCKIPILWLPCQPLCCDTHRQNMLSITLLKWHHVIHMFSSVYILWYYIFRWARNYFLGIDDIIITLPIWKLYIP
jgi:hypothetical protein